MNYCNGPNGYVFYLFLFNCLEVYLKCPSKHMFSLLEGAYSKFVKVRYEQGDEEYENLGLSLELMRFELKRQDESIKNLDMKIIPNHFD